MRSFRLALSDGARSNNNSSRAGCFTTMRSFFSPGDDWNIRRNQKSLAKMPRLPRALSSFCWLRFASHIRHVLATSANTIDSRSGVADDPRA